jgi:3-oxoacyl-[acyl-carrier-protein] synthase II
MPRGERRVVVTGIGLVTPLGIGVDENWDGLMSGRSGIAPISRFDAGALPTRFAGEVRAFDPTRFIEKRELKRMDRFVQFALAAAQLAMGDSGLRIDSASADRVGVILGVGMGGMESIEDTIRDFNLAGLKKVSPFFIPRVIVNMAPGQIAIRFGARGPNYAAVSACASATHAIGEAYRLIRDGRQDAMITGGAEACVTPLGVAGFSAMRALSTRNEAPEHASRPFDRQRDGFVIAEGAGVLILEAAAAAQARRAPIYAEIVGYGASADAFHITAPAPEGDGAVSCMRVALEDAGITPEQVDYINAHGTSTPHNDTSETQAIKHLFGAHAYRLAVSSTKSQTGHLMGAAGGVEAGYVALALARQVIPPTVNYDEPDPTCDLDYVPNQPRPAPLHIALSNSFGFGGTNACLVVRRGEQG